MRLEPREQPSLALTVLAPVLAVGVALVLCSLLIWWAGAPPARALGLLLKGSLGSTFALTETLTRATPLIFTGLAAAVAFRAKLWNIGAEGQLYAGAVMATWLGTGMLDLPAWVMVPLLFAAGALAGGLLLLGPTLLKTRLAVDEVVTTLLLNFVVILAVNWLVFGPWKDPMAMGWPQAAPVVDAAVLAPMVAKTRLHWGFVVALACATTPEAPCTRAVLRTALLSGGLAGMAGVSELAGLKGYLTLDLSPGFGYSGVVVAMLAALHPLGVVAAALFVAVMSIGADSMSRSLEISNYIADVATALSLLAVLVSMLAPRWRIRWR
jgi:simple sugar transport system permease protein